MSRVKRVVLAGASGVVGQALIKEALRQGWEPVVLSRSESKSRGSGIEYHTWSPALNSSADEFQKLAKILNGTELVINLAGSSIADGRMDGAHQKKILESRLAATQTLARAVKLCSSPPPLFCQISAIGYYGDRGEEELDESSSSGELFLSDVCRQWEASVRDELSARSDIRLAILRLGLVLDPAAPAWLKMARPIRFGLGGPLGSGRQWYSWIDSEDVARVPFFLMERPELSGVFNLVAPESVRQAELVRSTASLLKRPAFFPAPAWLLRLALGRLADELILASQRVEPASLLKAGFEFKRRDLEIELKYLLGRADDAV